MLSQWVKHHSLLDRIYRLNISLSKFWLKNLVAALPSGKIERNDFVSYECFGL